jgi:hypothetical protein
LYNSRFKIMSLLNDASLVMIPSGYKDTKLYSVKPTDGSGDFTFSRGSNLAATRVNSEGLIEKGRENLLLQSNTFDTTWVNTNVSVTSGQSGYDGTSDAWKIDLTGSGGHLRQEGLSYSGVNTFSIYLKAGSLGFARLLLFASPNNQVDLNLTTGAVSLGVGIVADSEDVGGGWFRFSITGNLTSATRVYIYPCQAIGDFTATSGNILIQDAQLEVGLVSTDVITTTTTTAQAGILEDMPRLDYSGGASCPSLLLEPQRSNLAVHSEYFEASNWTALRSTIALSSSTSPEGVLNAYKLTTDNTTNNTHIIYYNGTLSTDDYAFSVYAKADEFSKVGLGTGNLTLSAKFDLSNGSIITSGTHTASIEDAGNGWYRCSIVTTTTTPIRIVLLDDDGNISFDGDGTSGLYIYGHQCEAASYPTSYIPTYGASVTRAKDVCDGAGDADLYNDSQGVLFTEVSFARDRGQSSPFKLERISLSDGTSNNRILISNTTTANQIQAFIRNSSGTIFNETITITDITANNKIAVRYESGNYALYINGTQEATGTSSSVPSGLNELMYDGPTGNYEFEGKVKQTIYFPTALTNDELAALTTL